MQIYVFTAKTSSLIKGFLEAPVRTKQLYMSTAFYRPQIIAYVKRHPSLGHPVQAEEDRSTKTESTPNAHSVLDITRGRKIMYFHGLVPMYLHDRIS